MPDDEDDEMPLTPLRSRHQNRVPKVRGKNASPNWSQLLPADMLAEREAKVREFARRAELRLPLFPEKRKKETPPMKALHLFTESKSVTPENEIQKCLDCIVARWNARIPRKRFIKWTPLRIAEARQTLRMWTLDEVLAAIDLYGAAPWQKANGHRAIDTWLQVKVATEWCEKAALAAEEAERAKAPKDPRVAGAVADLAERLRLKREDEVLLADFEALPDADREAIFDQANAEIAQVHGRPIQGKAARSLGTHIVKQHVLMILRRQKA